MSEQLTTTRIYEHVDLCFHVLDFTQEKLEEKEDEVEMRLMKVVPVMVK